MRVSLCTQFTLLFLASLSYCCLPDRVLLLATSSTASLHAVGHFLSFWKDLASRERFAYDSGALK
jgi:hypothetical protein